MRLTKKVAKSIEAEKPRPTVEEELQLLKLIETRISTLQDAKLGAEGLANVISFCGIEGAGDEEFDFPSLCNGLYEVGLLLHKSLGRETDALERQIWDWKDRLAQMPQGRPQKLKIADEKREVIETLTAKLFGEARTQLIEDVSDRVADRLRAGPRRSR